MKNFGVKFKDGQIVKVKAYNHLQAKVAACIKFDRDYYAVIEVYPIGEYYDENGNAK